MNIFLDIETLPSLQPDAHEQSRQVVKPPGNIKKPESIAAWWKDEGDAAIEEAYRKQSLDAAHGELCAVGFASDYSVPVSLVRGLGEPEVAFIYRALMSVKELIDGETRTVPDGNRWQEAPFFVCHNAPFDLGFLLRRCWVNNLRPPFAIPGPSARDGKDYGDTMTAWAGYRGMIGLGRLCRALGVPSPKDNGIDGSQIFDRWQAGEHDAIAHYNAADVKATRSCWKRLNWIEERDKVRAEADAKARPVVELFESIGVKMVDVMPVDDGATMTLGRISTILGFNLTAMFLEQLGFKPVAHDKNAKLYRASDFPRVCAALVQHINGVAGQMREAA